MPCAAVPSTRTVTPPLRKSIGAVRRDLPRAKNGQVIKSCASRGAQSPGKARNRTNGARADSARSEEHTSELQSLMRISYPVYCLNTKQQTHNSNTALII